MSTKTLCFGSNNSILGVTLKNWVLYWVVKPDREQMRTNQSDAAEMLKNVLAENIRRRVWEPASKLPTERQLSSQFGVGRSIVRRALSELGAAGLITRSAGSGSFVCAQRLPAPARAITPCSWDVSPAHLMEARMLLEPAIVEMVVRNGTAADMAYLGMCCDKGEAAVSFEEFEHWDGMLHRAIAGAAHNSLFDTVFDRMNKSREQAEWGQLKLTSLTPERRRIYETEHRSLVLALKNRDGDTARRISSEHLQKIRANLFGF
jgi:DNA-binding FadR family transcriptional regulator